MRDIIEVVTELDMDESAIIVNDQLGRGRTTRTLGLIKLLHDWLRSGGKVAAPRSTRPSYTVINNLLRVIKNGFEVSVKKGKTRMVSSLMTFLFTSGQELRRRSCHRLWRAI